MTHGGDGAAFAVSILHVDAHEESLRALSAILAALPDLFQRGAAPEARIRKASSRPDALRALLREDFALILLDVSAPTMDGFEIARAIKRSDRSKHIPLILLTADGRESAGRGEEVGAVDVLARPLDPGVVRAKVAVFVELARRAQEIQRKDALLEAATRIREEFLSIASHELRTPLSALKLQVQSLELQLRRTPIEADRLFAKVAVAERQVERLTRLVNELLEVSRIEAGRLELDREQTDLGELVRDVAGRFAAELERTGGSIELDLAAGVVGDWDRPRLDQVITNLLQNALKYGRSRPIRVTLGVTADVARLEVKDEGIGISAGDQRRIFGRFERAVSSRAYGGMGVGLFIADQILRAHDGTIAVRSEPSVGSSFIVELPCHPAGARVPALIQGPPSGPRLPAGLP